MKKRHLTRLIALSVMALLMLPGRLVSLRARPNKLGWYDIVPVHSDNYFILYSIQGSGAFIHAYITDRKGLDILMNRHSHPSIPKYKLNPWKYDLVQQSLGKSLPSYPEGNILVAQLDRDTAIEICTFPQEIWKGHTDPEVYQINESGMISRETESFILTKAAIMTFLSNRYLNMLLLFSAFLILLSWGIEAFFTGLTWLILKIREKNKDSASP